jgi:hypothetical protein
MAGVSIGNERGIHHFPGRRATASGDEGDLSGGVAVQDRVVRGGGFGQREGL